jgi:hypothetical protein
MKRTLDIPFQYSLPSAERPRVANCSDKSTGGHEVENSRGRPNVQRLINRLKKGTNSDRNLKIIPQAPTISTLLQEIYTGSVFIAKDTKVCQMLKANFCFL